MKNVFFCTVALALTLSGFASNNAWAQSTEKKDPMEAPKPTEKDKGATTPDKGKGSAPATPPTSTKKPETEGQKPAAEAITCTLLTKEAPRGGRLEVRGDKLGKSPVVKIDGAVTRIIERPGDKIAVQIPPKSNGGAVVVLVDGKDITCGTLTIIGLD